MIQNEQVDEAAIHIWGPGATDNKELWQKLKEVMVSQDQRHHERHYSIVNSIYYEQKSELRFAAVMMGRPGERGHRYYGERCVWCGVNHLDEQIYDSETGKECPGPEEGDWDMDWFPLDKIDALLKEHREPIIRKRLNH